MQSSIRFIFSMFVSIALIYMLVWVAHLYAWVIIPCMLPAIVLFWKKDKLIEKGALAALMLGLVALGILIYAAASMKIDF